MNRLINSLRKCITWERWQFLYIVLSLSWLLGPSLNHYPSAQTAFISQYEDPGQPWSWFYRVCDLLAASLLGLALVVIMRLNRTKKTASHFYAQSVILLGVVVIGSFIDAAFPSVCHDSSQLCSLPGDFFRFTHASESVITTIALLAFNFLLVLRKMSWAKTVLAIQLIWIIVFVADQVGRQYGNTFVQFAYMIAVTLLISRVVPRFAGKTMIANNTLRPRLVLHIIAAWIFLGGFFAVTNAVLNLNEASELSSAYFGDNTAWLSQHGVAVGIALMYISRHLWRGEYRAWQLATLLLWLETLKYAVLSPNGTLVLLYGLTAAILFMQRSSFNRLTSIEQLQERLKKILFVTLAVLVALSIGVLAFRLKHNQDVDTITFNFGQFTKHLFLFDIVNDLGPLPHRLIGQVFNVAGLSLLMLVLISMFRPQKLFPKPFNEQDRQKLLVLLGHNSTSSEDYFKYWPQPKNYWWDANHKAIIAYRVVGSVAFALADPVAQEKSIRKLATKEFIDYCRQNGWRACFLMVSESSQASYKNSGYKLFRIGASALVDIEEFLAQTMHNKWWRWVLNKAKKQGWQYDLASPPHGRKLMAELRYVSSVWLQHQKHIERGFALGYFDEKYLQHCRLHLLRCNDKIIAFANELPIFNNLPVVTIDLMRFSPQYKHAMPALLAYSLQQLKLEGLKRKFDLGFVPLASPSARTEQVIKVLGQLLISETISAQGLEQFKNKFSPTWINNYLAFDGDWIDLLHISRQLDNLLKL